MRGILRVTVGALLALPVVGACGGGTTESPGETRAFEVIVHESNASKFHATVKFAAPTFATHEMGSDVFTEFRTDACHPGATQDGKPGVPVFTRLLAVPQGARAVLMDVNPVVDETRSLLLYPFQARDGDYSPAFEQPDLDPVPLAEETWKPPFAYDRLAYIEPSIYPSAPVALSPLSLGRDLSVGTIQIAAGQYAPEPRALTLFRSVEFTVAFEGATGGFLQPAAANPFEEGSLTTRSNLLNRAAVENLQAFVPGVFVLQGEELLILSDPDYRSAADRLAAHKNGRGLLTTVVTVADGPGGPGPDTKEEIKAFLDAHWHSALIRFSYLLLLGDSGDIAPWILPRRYTTGDFASDFPYAQIDTDAMAEDLVPEIAVGRIPAGSLAEADVVVDKIIQYESSPPVVLPGGTFYGRAAIASYFQPGQDGQPANVENLRRFVQDSEEVRGHLVNQGFDVQRIYVATLPLTPTNVPTYYHDEVTLLPAPLRPQDAYPWDGNAAQITGAFNAGKCLFFHVDHGGSSGWGHPHFVTSDLPTLTNGDLLPVVLSDNCSSGAFDYGSPGFAESILRMSGGGAIGVMAFTRNSNNGVGRQFLVGVVDALWPDTYPTIGDDQQHPRLGDMLNHVRFVMTRNYTSADPTADGYLGAWCYARMITLFGDPTLEPWIENPIQIPLPVQYVDGPVIELHYPLGGVKLTLFEETADGLVAIGRATTDVDGVAHVTPLVAVTDVNALRFFASAPGAVATQLTASPR